MALFGLFWTSLLAATLLPGGSEAALLLAWQQQWAEPAMLLLAATAGNTIGGLITFWMGSQARRLKSLDELQSSLSERQQNWVNWLHRFGHWGLILSWTPIIGDLLCLAGGWLRFNPWFSAVAMLIGKALRYLFVLWAASHLT
ncbi:DedA family protein [Neiella marina]|uniref:DedA family protein n=1 Tax=Neiella holothuriorum TaxID=2870530 RepID=A0ABS7EJX8_9GAMM|nr:YqaA family protein [Neiella holothuriorum]MBW8192173.1 DedA family protein [Neiella holothuriorum]